MTTLGKFILAVVIVALAVFAFIFLRARNHEPAQSSQQATTTASTIIPGTPNKTYVNSKLSFSITYPADATSSPYNFSGYLPLTQTPLVSFVLPPSLYQGTNLEESGVYVGASSSPQAITSCASSMQGETAQGAQTINGADFQVFVSSGAGAGNFYDSKIYRRLENGWCVEVVELLHSGNIGNYTPGSVTEFDKKHFQGILDAIVHTYRSIPTGV